MAIKEKEIEKGKESFRSDSGLLLELGERLVANRHVAITELVKNAYDADSPYCHVWYDEENGEALLHILDRGHGMTIDEFRNNWMTIATREKIKRRISKIFKRTMTGAKGIGRFAVRFIGKKLILQSVAYDTERGTKTRLTADFDWSLFISGMDLQKVEVPYILEEVGKNVELGSHLIIKDLNEEWDYSALYKVSNDVLKITEPIQGLNAGSFSKRSGEEDPGFEVYFSAPDKKERKDKGVASRVIDYSWARINIEMSGKKLKYSIVFRDGSTRFNYTHNLENAYVNGLYADIRFFPYRQGVFSGIPLMNGREAHKWVLAHSGVAIIDHGFRMRPYGYPDDDWLNLAADKATNRREWRSPITERVFPSKEMSREEKLDPALFLPANHQLVGAVFLESYQSDTVPTVNMLIPAGNSGRFGQ